MKMVNRLLISSFCVCFGFCQVCLSLETVLHDKLYKKKHGSAHQNVNQVSMSYDLLYSFVHYKHTIAYFSGLTTLKYKNRQVNNKKTLTVNLFYFNETL